MLPLWALSWVPAPAGAQPQAPARLVDEQVQREGPDPTRLDAERLPPEAIELRRELYAHGLFVETDLMGRGFLGAPARLLHPGPMLAVAVGYEVFGWLWVRAALEGSLHRTAAPPPPSPTAVELLGASAELRLQVALGARAALWVGGEAAVTSTFSDVLDAYGASQGTSLSLSYGGRLGFDWHMRNRHASIGLFGAARLHPGLDVAGLSDGLPPLAIRGGVYLRHVF